MDIQDISMIVMAAANIVLVSVTGWYAWQTRRLSRQNSILVERDYIASLLKHSVKPLKNVIGELIEKYSSLRFDWTYVDGESMERLPFKAVQPELFQSKDNYYIPRLRLLTSEELADHPELGSMGYYTPLLIREKRLRRVIDQYNNEASELWYVLWTLGIRLVELGLKDSTAKLMETHSAKAISATSGISGAQLGDLKLGVHDHCLFLACSKLLMENEAYVQLLEIYWADELKRTVWEFWKKYQVNLLGRISDNKDVNQLIASGRQRSKILLRKIEVVQRELSKIETSYMRDYYIRPEDLK